MLDFGQHASTQTNTDAYQAYLQIKNRIITTAMPPGTVVLEANLMRELGLGRTPVREALRMLQGEKLVTVVPRQGTYVSPVAITDVQAIHEVRLEIDPLCARLAAKRMPEQITPVIEQLIARLADPVSHADPRLLLDLDREAHFLLAETAHNAFLFAEFEKMYNLSQRVCHLYIGRLHVDDLALGSLADVLQSVAQRNADRAWQSMRRHLIQSHESIRQLI